ncbi:MAG: FtsX-like permease family protein [Brevinematales bacterium]
MGSIFKFALRNVFRNSRRTFLTAASIFTAAIVVALLIGVSNGRLENVDRNYIDYQTGNLKITSTDYVSDEQFLPVDDTMTSTGPLISKIKELPGVSAVEQRVRFGILLGNDQDTVQAFGIGADLESPRLDLADKLLRPGKIDKEGLYLGYDLAGKLHLSPGDDILIATKTSSGGLNGIKARVKGLLSFGVGMFDSKFFFLDMRAARKLLKLQDQDTEIYIFTKKGFSSSAVEGRISAFLPKKDIVRNIGDQVGALYYLMQSARYIYFFIELLIIMLASFVIISTMMQAVFERMREIGTLKAMGMSDSEIFTNFTFEGAVIGAIGAVPGGLLGYLLVLWLSATGLNYKQAMSNTDMPFNYIVYPSISFDIVVITIIMTVIVSSAAAMIPARSAGKLMPAEALRKL